MLPTREQVLDLDPDSSIRGYPQRCIAKLRKEKFNNTLIVGRTLRVHETGKDTVADPQKMQIRRPGPQRWSPSFCHRFISWHFKVLSCLNLLSSDRALFSSSGNLQDIVYG